MIINAALLVVHDCVHKHGFSSKGSFLVQVVPPSALNVSVRGVFRPSSAWTFGTESLPLLAASLDATWFVHVGENYQMKKTAHPDLEGSSDTRSLPIFHGVELSLDFGVGGVTCSTNCSLKEVP